MIYPQNFEQKIGFNQIRQLLKGKCLSTLGEERVDSMAFSTTYAYISQQLDLTCEFLSILEGDEDFPAQFFFDVRPALNRVKVVGLFLEEQELFDLRRSLETIRDIVRFLKVEETERVVSNEITTSSTASSVRAL